MSNDRIRIPEPEWSKNLWKRVKAMITRIDGEIAIIAENAIESISQNGTPLTPDANKNVNINADANVINTVKQNGTALTPDANKAVNVVADANIIESISLNSQLLPVSNKNVVIPAKPLQSAKSSPAASGYALAFIDTVWQDEHGVIYATKKYMTHMTGATSQGAGVAGAVPAPQAGDEGKFLRGDGAWATPSGGGGGGGSVTGVKGIKESTYRTGDVVLTPTNLGAAPCLSITGTTLAEVYATLSGLELGETATCRIGDTAVAILTGDGTAANGVVTDWVEGVVTRHMATRYTFFARTTNGHYAYGWISELADDTSCVTSTVYKYEATQADIRTTPFANVVGTTLAEVYATLSALPEAVTATCRISDTAASILTGNGTAANGKVVSWIHGTVTRYMDNKYTFFCKSTDGSHIYSWISTLADNTSCVTSTVYQYSGTAI